VHPLGLILWSVHLVHPLGLILWSVHLVHPLGLILWSVHLVHPLGLILWSVHLVHPLGLILWSVHLVHPLGLILWSVHLVHPLGLILWSVHLVHLLGLILWSVHLAHPLAASLAPWQVPEEYCDPAITTTRNKQAMFGMIRFMDEAVGNVTTAMKALGLWNNTLLVFSADNGGEQGSAGNNFPLRGGKYTDFEGGVRVAAFATGGLVRRSARLCFFLPRHVSLPRWWH
jgi:hypothetical protein